MTPEVVTGKRSISVDVWVFDADSRMSLQAHDEHEITLTGKELVDSHSGPLSAFIDETVPGLIRTAITKALA